MHGKVLGISIAAAITVLAAGCGSASAGSGGSSSGGMSVTVGYVPFDDDAVLFLAKEKGIFAKHGLDVTLHAASSPTPILASMVSGQYQVGFITAPVLINANRQGQKVKCVSVVDGQVDPKSDSAAFVASAKSGISKLSQLSGKTVAVVQRSSLNLFEAKKLTQDAGSRNTKYVSIPFPQMPQALQSGRVDAALITSPFLQIALKNGAKKLATPNSQLFPKGTVYCFASTAKYLQDNGKAAKAFRAAMNETTLYAKDHLKEEKATLVKYMQLTPEVAQAQKIATNYVPKLNEQTLADIQDLMKSQGAIDSTVDPHSLIWNP